MFNFTPIIIATTVARQRRERQEKILKEQKEKQDTNKEKS